VTAHELDRVHERLDVLVEGQGRTQATLETLTTRMAEVCAIVIHDPHGGRRSLLSRVDALEAAQPRSIPPAVRHANRATLIAAVIGAVLSGVVAVAVAMLT